MAVYDWTQLQSKDWINPDNVRDPTIIFNNTALPIGGPVGGYTGTVYAFDPINFASNIIVPPSPPIASVWTTVKLGQFGIPNTARAIRITGNSGMTGPNMWKAVTYLWVRRKGSDWDLSPVYNGGYIGNFSELHIPCGVFEGEAAVDLAWGLSGLNLAAGDNAWMQAVISEWRP